MNRMILAAFGSLLVGGTTGFGMLFYTDFEADDYTANQPLVGQDGWTALVSADAAVVVDGHGNASSGRRAVACWGGGPLESVPIGGGFAILDGAWEQVIGFDPITIPAEVRVEADVRLDGPDTGTGPNDDLVSANLYARNGIGRSAFMFLSSNGNAYAFANSEAGSQAYRFETPITPGAYNHLAITLNYSTHMATFEVNRTTVGTLPFGGAGEQWRGVLLEFGAFDDPSVDPTLYTGYWDDISVRAKPAR